MLKVLTITVISLAILFTVLPSLPVIAQDSANEIFITITDLPDPIIDGKWSSEREWSHSSERKYEYEDGSLLVLRASHDRENIFVMVDMVSDITRDNQKDQAVVCFDTAVNGGDKPDADDYCFTAVLNGSFTSYRGGGTSQNNNYLEKVTNPSEVEMKAGVSSTFDRYSPIPHLAYELKVPVDSLKRSDIYGFYVSVFDANNKTAHNWPLSVSQSDEIVISSPNEWGKLISPDKSLPEFPIVNVMLFGGIILLVTTMITRRRIL